MTELPPPPSTDPQPQTAAIGAWNRAESWCRRRFVAFLICVVAALAAYAPAIGGGLIWDDTYLVGENPFFKSPVFGLEVFRHWLFFESFSTYYRPVQNWSFMLDYWLWRGNPAGYHLTNIALHATTGFLLCRLLLRALPSILRRDAAALTSRAGVLSLAIGALWVVHPVHNAAVAYISGRADSLAAVFALGAWLLALRAEEAQGFWRRMAWGSAAAVAVLVALCSKEIALMWLVLFLAHHWWQGSRGVRGKLVTTGVVLAVLAIYAGLHSLPAHRAAMEGAPAQPFEARGLLMLRALGDYTGLMFFPGKLYMERMLTDDLAYQSAALWRTHSRGEWLSAIGLLALLGAAALCRWRAPGRALRIAGAAWFAIAFLPISNLFPLNAEVAEHWIYLASIGFIALVAGAVLALPQNARRWACVVAALGFVALTARTAVRSDDWTDAETFCLRTIASGGATPRIFGTLAGIYGRKGDVVKQESVLRETLRRFPGFTPARIQLGVCLEKQNRSEEARSLLDLGTATSDVAAKRFPRTWGAALNLARLKHEAGDTAAALEMLAEARKNFPETWEIVRYRAELLQQSAGTATALPDAEYFAATHWWHLEARLTVGKLRENAGDTSGAIAAYEQAQRLDLYDGQSYAGIARVELALHRGSEALEAQCAALARDPNRAAHYFELGAILEQLGRREEATAAVQKARVLAARAGDDIGKL